MKESSDIKKMSSRNKISRKIARYQRTFEYLTGSASISYSECPLNNRTEIQGSYIIASKRGLYHLKDSKLYLLMNGQFYGVTIIDKDVYVFQRMNESGRLIRLFLNSHGRFFDLDIIMMGFSPGCHQIDWIDSSLFVTDTYNNRILELNLQSGSGKAFYPLGKLKRGRASSNYAHINSILKSDDYYLVYCHNETLKTGRHSTILVLNSQKNLLEEIQTNDGNGHNLVVYDTKIYHCDSMKGSLKLNSETVFQCDHFTRGLSISKAGIVLGGSDYAKRSRRTFAGGHLYILSYDHELIDDFSMPAMVQEIRRLDAADFSLSQYSQDWNFNPEF